MKNLEKDMQAVTKELKALTRKAEALAKKVAKLEKAQAAKKPKAKAKVTKKARARKKVAAKKKAPAKKRAAKPTATDQVVNIIKRSKKGVDVPTLVKKTGLADKTVRNILFRASKQRKIKRSGRGVYVAR
jgi:septal ring factor EnvC (AmiA/AmiB activator)